MNWLRVVHVFVLLTLLSWNASAQNIYTVTNQADTATPGTLRYCITTANLDKVASEIHFDLPEGQHTITVGSPPLPSITESVVIDGTTDPHYSGSPIVKLDGGSAGGSSYGLFVLNNSSSVVRGLHIERFGKSGIGIAGGGFHRITANCIVSNVYHGVEVSNSTDNVIGGTNAADRNVISGHSGTVGCGILMSGTACERNTVVGNYLGTDSTGTNGIQNRIGVWIGDRARSNTVGGTASGERNVIAPGNTGVRLDRAGPGTIVAGNYIGTDANGTKALGGWAGLYGLSNEAARIGPGNVISGNAWGMALEGASNTTVVGNYIGPDASGQSSLPNCVEGIFLYGSCGDITIGGTNEADRNVIAGCLTNIHVSAGSMARIRIRGNYIGVGAAGTNAMGSKVGILVEQGAGIEIGGEVPGARNVISGNTDVGVRLAMGGMTNIISGNCIGTDAEGRRGVGNGCGIALWEQANTLIGGTSALARNVISGNGAGVFVNADSPNTRILGNFIGLDVNGSNVLGNLGSGVQMDSASNIVGGVSAGERNVISGNGGCGISLAGPANRVLGNYIGVYAWGGGAAGNSNDGLYIWAPDNQIGGTNAASRNVVSGNQNSGIHIATVVTPATGNWIRGNYIGTDASGTQAVPNRCGISVQSAADNSIGGATSGAGNLISGNTEYGINLTEADRTLIAGNRVGTDATGLQALGNGAGGIFVNGTAYTTIGGTNVAARNLVSGHRDGPGIELYDQAHHVQVQGNYVGVDATGTNGLPNRDGILISLWSSNNWVGGTNEGAGNVIAFGHGGGVRVLLGQRNAILRNSIFANLGLGIDLGNDFVTPNDPQDPDSGANLLQNYPVITAVTGNGASVTIQATLNSVPSTRFRIEYFSSRGYDHSRHGEGQIFLGAHTGVLTDVNGDASFTNTFTPAELPDFITATATDPEGNTSEFSLCAKLDSDGDGLSDGWEQRYFGGYTNAQPYADSDGDLMNNLEEYNGDTDPTDRSSVFRIAAFERNGGGVAVGFPTSPYRYYDTRHAGSVDASWWDAAELGYPGDGSFHSVNHLLSTRTQSFYRVEARWP